MQRFCQIGILALLFVFVPALASAAVYGEAGHDFLYVGRDGAYELNVVVSGTSTLSGVAVYMNATGSAAVRNELVTVYADAVPVATRYLLLPDSQDLAWQFWDFSTSSVDISDSAIRVLLDLSSYANQIGSASSTCTSADSDCEYSILLFTNGSTLGEYGAEVYDYHPTTLEVTASTSVPVYFSYLNTQGVYDRLDMQLRNYSDVSGGEAWTFSWQIATSGTIAVGTLDLLAGDYSVDWRFTDSTGAAADLFQYSKFRVVRQETAAFGYPDFLFSTSTGQLSDFCDFFSSEFSPFKCLVYSVIPTKDQLQTLYDQATSTILNKAPMGYALRIKELFLTDATSTLPSLVLTIPAGLAASGASIDLSPWNQLMGSSSIIAQHQIGDENAVDFFSRMMTYVCSFLLIGYFLFRIPSKLSSNTHAQ